MAVRFGVSSTVDNRLPKYSNFWDGTAVYNPYTPSSSYDALATYTVPSGGVSSVTFSGLPTGGQYSHLQIRASYKLNSGSQYCTIRFNDDSTASNYSVHLLGGEGTGSVYAGGGANTIPYVAQSASTANIFGASIIDILDYSSVNKYKTIRTLLGQDKNGSGDVALISGSWRSFNAINSFTIIPNFSAVFSEYSTFSVYGVR